MPAADVKYRRLPGRSGSVGAYYRIYSAPDHILSTTAQGFSESYRRFFYRDIQAIIVQRTGFANVITGIFASLLGLTILVWIGALTGESAPELSLVVANSIFTAVFAAVLIVNLWRGPACRCYIKTAVQTERLFAVGRIRAARKFLERVRPLILAAQGVAPSAGPAAAPGAGQPAGPAPISAAGTPP